MRFLSLFSGIGGFDLGFQRAGFECVAQVEKDKDCQRVLKRHWPSVELFDDVTTVGKLKPVDVICGGFPCQDLSVAGKRKGLAGERSGLWFEFLRIIEFNKPRWIVIENVPGLLSSDDGRDFAVILRGLVGCGYGVSWRILDAQYFGVAQRRRRVFIVGSLGDGSSAQVLFESEGVSGDSQPRREARAGTSGTAIRRAQTSSNGWGIKQDGSTGIPDGTGGDAVMCIKGAAIGRAPENGPQYGEVLDDGTCYTLNATEVHAVTHALSAEGADASEDGTGRWTPLVAGFTPSDHGNYREGIPTMRAQGGDCGGGSEGLVAQAIDVRNLRIQPDGISGTVQHKKSGGYSLNYQNPIAGSFGVRRLTPTECERLQGFPDGHTAFDHEGKAISDSARYRMLGNAVAVPCAYWIGKRIMEAA